MKNQKTVKQENKKLQDIINRLKKEKKEARIIVFKNGKIVVLTEEIKEKNKD